MMTFLLDTQIVLWALLNPSFLSRTVAALLADRTNTAHVSAATAWEIATKVRIGKLPVAALLEQDFLSHMERADYSLIAINAAHALRAARLSGPHKDPWDRMIAAQALELDIPVLSVDPKLDQFGVRRIW
jgi:PIN domain nuclease of toxin-antitoxin system